jgi:hypothetical protein
LRLSRNTAQQIALSSFLLAIGSQQDWEESIEKALLPYITEATRRNQRKTASQLQLTPSGEQPETGAL